MGGYAPFSALNYGSVSILGLTCYKGKNPGFLIAGPSNIGNMNIQGSDLSSFPLISFLDCSLFGLKYSNVKWFDPKILNQNNSKAPDFWERKQEAYRQLKYCAEDNKDKIAYSGAYPFTFRGCNSPSIKV